MKVFLILRDIWQETLEDIVPANVADRQKDRQTDGEDKGSW